MIYVTRREVFAASHRLYNSEISEEENLNLYGKCSNKYGHGHNYTLEVIVAGTINPKTGYLIDLKILKDIIREEIINYVDHKHFNFDVPFMTNIIPTSENIATSFWNRLVNKLPSGKLYSVKLYETENNYVEYKGE
ncbi:MAG: 6-carboxytetrahydropterin synthase [Ignavibacteria bacterium]|jgi:6-pyruvoyltetrahydropterin/6-carboxytetrahydropterin synthase|nr:6-carboxytetrahydropterin synthase [Ignavibacteria bacterium]